jgi:hypothetical protein
MVTIQAMSILSSELSQDNRSYHLTIRTGQQYQLRADKKQNRGEDIGDYHINTIIRQQYICQADKQQHYTSCQISGRLMEIYAILYSITLSEH